MTDTRKTKRCVFQIFRIFCAMLPVFFFLSACGFSPIYGAQTPSGSTAEALNQIAIDNIPDRNGQMLRNHLIDRFYGKGRPANPLYRLTVNVTQTLQDLGIQANATSTRTLLDMTASYTLNDAQGKTVLFGTAHSVTNFNRLSDQYGSLVASEYAQQRALNEVSEQIVNRVSLFMAEPLQKTTPQIITPQPSPSPNSQALPTTSQTYPRR